uniref:Uncharacterized protein n=1 Tax=viral metagenome TaxID=1070528 RepID=A0A6M3L5J5_9ZZZZ
MLRLSRAELEFYADQIQAVTPGCKVLGAARMNLNGSATVAYTCEQIVSFRAYAPLKFDIPELLVRLNAEAITFNGNTLFVTHREAGR